ncbi:NYN domain-containing protein [Acetobacterium fimetarium]|uniref:NYN domain-containing protein n=1 Tax=Acetobacterium fimetarium TaxID=52691 RepID=UPI001A9B6507|nr:NYN domain-containing protein [Acetobacterium fimetarium]
MKTILIVDGYNVIHGSDDLKRLSEIKLEEAREKLISDLNGYSGFKGWETILVFDAYQQESFETREEMHGRIKVVFTEKNKTADAYIEKLVYGLPNSYTVQVVTSDYTLQRMVLASGAQRVPSRELIEDMAITLKNFRDKTKKSEPKQRVTLSDFMDEDTLEKFRRMRIKE